MATARILNFPALDEVDLNTITDSYDNLGDISVPRPFTAEIVKVEDVEFANSSGWNVFFKIDGVPPIRRYYAFTNAAIFFLQRLYACVGVTLGNGQPADPDLLVGEKVTVIVGHGNERNDGSGGFYTDIKNVLPYVERPTHPVDIIQEVVDESEELPDAL